MARTWSLASTLSASSGIPIDLHAPVKISGQPVANILASTTKGQNGQLTGGFGFINYVGGSTFQPPRQGTLEMRLSF